MAGYLEAYGAAEQQHAKRVKSIKWTAGSLAVLLVLGAILFSVFRNFAEERQVKAFVELLKNKDYQSAYRMWGCTDATPCRDYAYTRFLEDWGPSSPHADAANAKIGDGDTCGTGVVVPLDFKGTEEVPLWVERANKTIGFSPDPECRKKRLHITAFLRSVFKKK